MYEQHWQLQRPPFGTDPHPDSYFVSDSHHRALLKLKFLIQHRRDVGLLVGPTGAGKTRLIESLLEPFKASCPIVRIIYPQLSPIELVRSIAGLLGQDSLHSNATTIDGMLNELARQLVLLADADRAPIIVVDDAHCISDKQVWQSLQLLLNYQHHQGAEFSLILSGAPELVGMIRRFPQLDDRVSMPCILTAMSADETAAYIQHRLRAAGSREPIFTTAALQVIHELSGGMPRRINRLCDFALLVGFADELASIDAAHVEAVWKELTPGQAA